MGNIFEYLDQIKVKNVLSGNFQDYVKRKMILWQGIHHICHGIVVCLKGEIANDVINDEVI